MIHLRLINAALIAVAFAATVRGSDPLQPTDLLGQALWQDLSDGRLDDHDLFTAALISGGVADADQLETGRTAFQRLADICQRRLEEQERKVPRAVAVFQVMHQEALTGSFHDSAWQLERSMRGGPFNCVTSSVLYLSLCHRFDIEATAVAQKHHVYCRLTDGATVDVQTTCAEWFDADGKPRRGKFRDLPTGQPRLISETQLLGKIYYNRAVSLSIAKHCRPAIDHFRRAVALDPQDVAAEQNLLAAINNWALQLSDAGRYAPAARFIVEGLELSPTHRELLANDLHVHQQWAIELCRTGSFAEAVRILESCHRRRADVELFDQGRWSVYHRWAESLLERQQFDEMHAVFAQAQARYGDVPELQACMQAVRTLRDQREFHTACP